MNATTRASPINVGRLEIRYLVDGAAAGGLGMFELKVPPRSNVPPPHRHNPVPARALIVISPDIGAKYFEDIAEVVNAGGPPDKTRLVGVMERYGLVPAAARP